MRKAKWIFFGYLIAVFLLIAGIAVSFNATPARDPSTLYFAYSGAIKTMDPAEVGDTLSGAIVGQFYECLYNYEYAKQPYTLMPEVAQSLPETSKDGLTMTIKIRPGIRFYDPEKIVFPGDGIGPEITAADVIYSFKRIADFNTASPVYSAGFQGTLVGLDDWWAYTKAAGPDKIDWDKPVAGMEVVDPHTVRFHFTQPSPQFKYSLAQESTGIVCRKVVERWKTKFRAHPVGTGPYAVAENLREQRIVLVANPAYRGKPDMDGTIALPADQKMPYIKRLQLEYFDEPLPVWMLFNQGLFDIGGIPKDSFSSAISATTGELTPKMSAKGIVLRKTVQSTTEFLGFNMQDPILGKNKPLRQAMSMAFDRKSYIELFTNGRGTPAIGPIPPGFTTYDENRINPNTQFDLTKARALMKEAEKINGGPIPTLTILMREADTTSRQMAEFFSSQMAQIGVTLVPEFRDFARWNQMIDARQAQVFDGGWQADYPDEQNFLQLYYGKYAPPGGVNNTAYVNPQFDALYEKAMVMDESPQRTELYRQMEQIVEDDCPMLLEYYPIQYTLSYDWLGNLNAMNYGYGFRQYVKLNSELRSQRQMGKAPTTARAN